MGFKIFLSALIHGIFAALEEQTGASVLKKLKGFLQAGPSFWPRRQVPSKLEKEASLLEGESQVGGDAESLHPGAAGRGRASPQLIDQTLPQQRPGLGNAEQAGVAPHGSARP